MESSASPSKEEFLREFGNCYGYPDGPKSIDEIRATEFKRLQGKVYLDHAGATLYSEKQMEEVTKDLLSNVYGNPHSQNDSSTATSDLISEARQQVLRYFKASLKDYKCIFTSGATGALKLVGEFFPWSEESHFMYTLENHNSVLGIREYALNKGATVFAVDAENNECQYDKTHCCQSSYIKFVKHNIQRRSQYVSRQNTQNGGLSGEVYNMFAFPSECSFSGQKFPLDIVNLIKGDTSIIMGGQHKSGSRCMVLVDAAKGCATDPPNLEKYPADFVVFSFYKIFGYPTGLGALLVRNDAAHLLKKTYFSGGTVSASISDMDFIRRRESVEQLFEDGTASFLSIAAIRHGFNIIDSLSIAAISRHTSSLASYTRKKMSELKHENGIDVCAIYGGENHELGPTIAFNLRREDRSWVGSREVEKLASLSGVHLRTGCFCNPGACAKYLGLSHSDLISNYEAGHVCWDDNDVINGKPTGAVRISFGYMSTYEDSEQFMQFLESSFMSKSKKPFENGMVSTVKALQLSGSIQLKSITIYPIKSCSGFNTQRWPLGNVGLKYDREWLLKGPSGEILTQKKVPEMNSICTLVDLKLDKLYVESPKCKEKLEISLLLGTSNIVEEIDVYGYRYQVHSYDADINAWFTRAIGRSCTLVRCTSSQYRFCKNDTIGSTGMCRENRSQLSFANEAQLLLVSEDSVLDLNSRLSSKIQKEKCLNVDAMRFRPNLVISGSKPYSEDNWRSLKIGNAHFTSLGGCNRCEMINLSSISGRVHKLKEPLLTLASYRRNKGKILFGILLRYEDETGEEEGLMNGDRWLHVGQEVYQTN
ncbi:Molybdenum cofactor sulfurase [Rhynchospora pubera]|uniref:Molybdenum cofactor sulfurase n=1 Tax=Rhynchospora pubera TaxID=906938 RepID=A0AAV8H0S0_9POAL|nr:Molybdenum cofactor sulfurase [Rhynchospora pubera]